MNPVHTQPPVSRQGRLILIGVVGLATLSRLVLGWYYFGFHSGDDVEILRAGFLRAFGLPFIPWEIRNLLVSDLLVAPVLEVASALGAKAPATLAWCATLPFVSLASINVLLVFALGRRWLENEAAALCAGALYAFHWIPLGYGSTVYPRTASTTCVLVAALLVTRQGGAWWRELAAGALIAIGFAVRYSEVVFLLPLFGLVALRTTSTKERLLGITAICGGFVGMSLLSVGAEDWLTWGRPFASLLEFAKYTLVDREAASIEITQPWYWYLWRLPKWLPVTLLPLFFAQRSYASLRLPLMFVMLPLIALSLIHHKELRYLQGLIPFVALASGALAAGWWQVGRRRATVILLALSFGLGLGGITFLAKKSMPAVSAAHWIATQPGVSAVALEQAWAYGVNLYLPQSIGVRALPFRPAIRDLEQTVLDCDRIGLYEEHLLRTPELGSWLENHGFAPSRTFRNGRSRAVVVFAQVAGATP